MRLVLALALCMALSAAALEPIRVSSSVYYIRGDARIPSPANRGHTSNAGFVVTRDAAADLRLTRDFLVYLREKMGAAARDLEHFEIAYRKTDWSRYSHLPAFEAANRSNAYNTYIRMQSE